MKEIWQYLPAFVKGALWALISIAIGYLVGSAIGVFMLDDKPTIHERLDQIEARLDALENGVKSNGD